MICREANFRICTCYSL